MKTDIGCGESEFLNRRKETEMTENQALNIYLEMLFRDAEQSVRKNIDVEEIRKAKRLLLVRTVKQSIFRECLECLLENNSNLEIAILGEESDKKILKDFKIPDENLFIHQGHLNEWKVDEYVEASFLKTIDMICFFNYDIHSEKYLNVEGVCQKLSQGTENSIFSYCVRDKQWNYYYDIERHIKAVKTYCTIFRWLNAYILREI